MPYWVVLWGVPEPAVRIEKAPDPFAAMQLAYGMKAENISVRQLPSNPARMSHKALMDVVKDMTPKHIERVNKLRPGHDRLVLPGLQRKEGVPTAEEVTV